LKYDPWFYFSTTSLSLFLLSYFGWDGTLKWQIGLWGILFPTLFSLFLVRKKPASLVLLEKSAPWKGERSLLILLAGLSVFIRLFQLTSLSTWPLPDEGLYSFYSIELLKHWNWNMFFSYGQAPPAFNWLLTLFFKFFAPSLPSLWLFPALCSILSVILFYFSARIHFSRLFSFVLLALVSFGFWNLFPGRLCMGMGILNCWDAVLLGALGLLLKSTDDKKRLTLAVLLGFVTGLGLFITLLSLPWMGMIAWAVYGSCGTNSKKGGKKVWMAFLGPLLALFLAYVSVSLFQGNGAYARRIWALNWTYPSAAQWENSFSYIAAIFWGSNRPFTYGPFWGGMFNPLAGGAFLTGAIYLFQARSTSFARWMGAAFILSILPGLITTNFEIFRVSQAFPLMLVVGAAGLCVLCLNPPSLKKAMILTGVIALSSALDIYQLWGPYHRLWGTPQPDWYLIKSAPFYRADQILEKDYWPSGPGAVLSDLWARSSDETLTLATYPFNVVRNPKYSIQEARWVAVITDANNRPFLARRFSKGHWYWLGSLSPSDPGGLMMGVIPMEENEKNILLSWIRADIALQPVTSWVMHSAPRQSQKPALQLLFQARGSFSDDPFLQSCYWEKVFDRYQANNDSTGMLEALRKGLKSGYPSAHLYNAEGLLFEQLGHDAEARKAFQKALDAPINLTSAAENLENLDKP